MRSSSNEVEWVDDPDRGVVLSFNGVDAYADAGAETIPQMTQDNDFTWSVWINQSAGNGPNNVVLGNRYSPEGGDFAPREFIKFTPTKFEFHLGGGGQNCEYVDLADAEGEWVHYVVVKTGDSLTHYSNGVEGESSTFTSELQNPQPLYFGGDKTAENWNGMLDDIAIWDRALSADEVSELNASGIPQGGGELVPGLIAYWPFDGDLQDAVGDSHGEGMGSDDIVYASGKFGQGIELDGVDQFVETPVDNEEMFDFQDGTGFSISAWYKVGEFTKSWQALIAKGEGNRWRIHRRGGENILTGNGGNGDVPGGTPDINDGELHHIVLVSDPENDEVRLYSDGELSSSNNGPAIQSNENPMMIGENPDARNRTWSGIIDDVGIWNRPITESEIALIWNGGSGGSLLSGGGGPRVVGKFSADWTDDVEPEGTYMAGVAEVGDEFLHITDAANGANGAFTIEDFSNGAVFTDFEMSFRLHMSDSTCCGGGDDNAADHRPADGMSISIGNDLPDTIGLAEEGSGSGIRICFDMWDSGGGEAPAIDVWRGAEGEVGDGDQGAWSGGMLVRQKFNGVTSATEEEKFKDANGDYVWLWTQGEWVDVKISVKDGTLDDQLQGT